MVVKAKMLMKLCLGLEWDAEVSEELRRRWPITVNECTNSGQLLK